MVLTKSNQFGVVYEFGIADADAPDINGMSCRRIELRYEAQVTEESQDGEGHTDSVVTSKPNHRKITATASGYITNMSAFSGSLESFNFDGKFFIVTGVTAPREGGKFVEGSVEAVHIPGISG